MEDLAIKILIDINNSDENYITYTNYNNDIEGLDALEKLIRFDHAIKYLEKNDYIIINDYQNTVKSTQNYIAIIEKQGIIIKSKGKEKIRELV